MQALRHFFVGEILEQAAKDLLLAAAEFIGGIDAQAAPVRAAQDRIHEPGKNWPWNPDTARGYLWEGARELVPGFGVTEYPLRSEAQQRIAVGLIQFVSYYQQARARIAFQDVPEQGPGRLPRCVSVHNVNGGARNVQIAQVGRQH